MILKIDNLGTLERISFECGGCHRQFESVMALPKAGWMRERMLSILDNACECDKCVSSRKWARIKAREKEAKEQECKEQAKKESEQGIITF